MNDHDAQANDRAKKTSISQDFRTALGFLSRLPIKNSTSTGSLASASRTFGLVGLVIGMISGVVFVAANSAGLSAILAIVFALAATAIITGALHEDGLADIADGFAGGWTIERKLEIMRDSQIGTFGVLTLVFTVTFRILAYAEIIREIHGFIGIISLFAALGCLSRAPLPLMMYQLPQARLDGRAVDAGVPSHDNLRAGLFISIVAGVLCLISSIGFIGVVATAVGISVAYLAIRHLTLKHIKGYTGDVLGTLQQSTEMACLLSLMVFV